MNRDEIEQNLNLVSGEQMAEMVSYLIWGSVVSVTRAFSSVAVKIDAITQRVFVCIDLRWWAKMKRLAPIRRYWLVQAEKRSTVHIPQGWRSLYYYKGGIDGGRKHEFE
jgi:hypothetical protein